MDYFDEFDWDSGNIDKNLKHGITDDEIEQAFYNEPKKERVGRTGRSYLYSCTDSGDPIFVVFKVVQRHGLKLVRPISARPMSKQERRYYDSPKGF